MSAFSSKIDDKKFSVYSICWIQTSQHNSFHMVLAAKQLFPSVTDSDRDTVEHTEQWYGSYLSIELTTI